MESGDTKHKETDRRRTYSHSHVLLWLLVISIYFQNCITLLFPVPNPHQRQSKCDRRHQRSVYNDVTALNSNAFKCGPKTGNSSKSVSANPAFPSRENVVFSHKGRHGHHVKYTKNCTHLAVCYLLSSNGVFSNLHGTLPMQLFRSFQIIASHFSTQYL